jgi:hypothetical protein
MTADGKAAWDWRGTDSFGVFRYVNKAGTGAAITGAFAVRVDIDESDGATLDSVQLIESGRTQYWRPGTPPRAGTWINSPVESDGYENTVKISTSPTNLDRFGLGVSNVSVGTLKGQKSRTLFLLDTPFIEQPATWVTLRRRVKAKLVLIDSTKKRSVVTYQFVIGVSDTDPTKPIATFEQVPREEKR